MTYVQTAAFEHRFWLQVLGDHARFIYSTLAPKETQEIATAQHFIELFDNLLATARGNLTQEQWIAAASAAREAAEQIRDFKLHLIRRHLTTGIEIGLPPTFINHQVNEVEEYIRILRFLEVGQIPPMQNPIHHHLLWLLDAVGHAAGLVGDLDPVERRLIDQAEQFRMRFQNYHLKAMEESLYMRSGVTQFPALNQLTKEATIEIEAFRQFVLMLRDQRLPLEVLGTFSPLIPDHYDREECYYLTKLAEVAQGQIPDCDPTRPRVMG